MNDAISRLLQDHHQCDSLLANAEDAARRQQWPQARLQFDAAELALRAHFQLEEACLFPAFEQASGSVHGPTAVMRDEHAAMRDMLDTCRAALELEDSDGLQAEIDTLFVLIQQHNVKEENVLYPLCRMQVAGLDDLLKAAMPPLA